MDLSLKSPDFVDKIKKNIVLAIAAQRIALDNRQPSHDKRTHHLKCYNAQTHPAGQCFCWRRARCCSACLCCVCRALVEPSTLEPAVYPAPRRHAVSPSAWPTDAPAEPIICTDSRESDRRVCTASYVQCVRNDFQFSSFTTYRKCSDTKQN